MTVDVITKYSQPEVVAYWRDLAATGLQAAEAAMLRRYAPPPGRALDLGCGGGRAALALLPLGYDVTGLDIAFPMVQAAQTLAAERALSLPLLQARLEALPLAPDSFDVALIFIAAFQHLPGQAVRRATLRAIARSLRPDGRLILALDNIAPALTCYAWWAGTLARRRLTGQKGTKPTSAGTATSAADAQIHARRRQFTALSWHARGLLRTLRWRTWTGWVDRARSLGLLSGQAGDHNIQQVSTPPTDGAVPYHIYQHDELLADARAAGLTLLGYHADGELRQKRTFPPRVRQLDKQILYAFTRPT